MDKHRQSSLRQSALPHPIMTTLSHTPGPVSLSPSRTLSRSPVRYNDRDMSRELNEKSEPTSLSYNHHHHSSRSNSWPKPSSPTSSRLSVSVHCQSSISRAQQSPTYTRPRGLRIANLLRRWMPVLLYVFVSLASLVGFALYKTEVFALLDELSTWLRADEYFGYAVLFCMIFLTTIPPIPLYSTLIVLAGYTFGAWTGAVISYCAGLAGALFVFILSRSLLRQSISRWLSSCESMQRVVCAIEKRPTLLFLIRLAPYPYNVMNCLLAAAPTLTLRTYTICTALSLFKVIVHTGLGASIHSFKDYQNTKDAANASTLSNQMAQIWTVVGIVLCVAILVYLSIVARRAVDDELEHGGARLQDDSDDEERVGFLSPLGQAPDDEDIADEQMAQSPFSRPLSRLSLDSRA